MPGVNSKSSRDLPSQEKGLDFSPLTSAPLARPRCCVAVAKRSVQRRKTTKRHAGCTAGPARHECQNAISGNDESSGVHVPGPPGARVSDAIADIYFTSLFFLSQCLSLFLQPLPKKQFLSQVDIHQIVTYC